MRIFVFRSADFGTEFECSFCGKKMRLGFVIAPEKTIALEILKCLEVLCSRCAAEEVRRYEDEMSGVRWQT